MNEGVVSTNKTKMLRIKYNWILDEKVELLESVDICRSRLLTSPLNYELLTKLREELRRIRELTTELVVLDAQINKILGYG